MRSARHFGIALLVAVAFAASGCKGGRNSEALQKEAFGVVADAESVDFTPYLATARAIVLHKDRPAGDVPPRPGQRVFVSVYSTAGNVVTTALGESLLASVVAASEAAAAKVTNPGEEARIKLDVVSEVTPTVLEAEVRVRTYDSGAYGFLFRDAGHVGFVLPSEMVTQKYLELGSVSEGSIRASRERLVAAMSERAGVSGDALLAMQGYRIKTTARVESSPPGRALPMHRAMLDKPPPMSATDLIDAVRAGGNYLAAAVDPRGKFAYMYHPVEDEDDKAYGSLRHAGATYALMEAYSELGTPIYRMKGELALGYIKDRFHATPDGSYLQDNKDEEQQKVGGNGLSLIAFAKHAQATGSREHLETMRALGRYIVHQQYPDGHFRNNADVVREDESKHGKKLKKEVSYFAGEALLGLTRLYMIDPQPQWLEAAKKGADYLVFERDAHESEDTQIHDHWLSYALNDLYRHTQKPEYAEHSFKIARAILKGMKTPANAPAPDYVSTFYEFAESTPASTRLEALAADMELSRFMGKPFDWIQTPATEIARHMRAAQIDAQSAFLFKRPERAMGGVRESIASCDVRIDYVQHAMSAWLHFARVLRDPAYGTLESRVAAEAAIVATAEAAAKAQGSASGATAKKSDAGKPVSPAKADAKATPAKATAPVPTPAQ